MTSISTSMVWTCTYFISKAKCFFVLEQHIHYLIFSSLSKHELFRLIYFSNISLSVMCFLSSSGSNHGYSSVGDFCSLSFFSAFTKLLKCSQSFFCFLETYNTCSNFVVIYPVSFYNTLGISCLQLLPSLLA